MEKPSIQPFQDVKKMSLKKLRQAYKEVCEDRDDHMRSMRKLVTKEDEEILERIDEWAVFVFDEIQSRKAKQ